MQNCSNQKKIKEKMIAIKNEQLQATELTELLNRSLICLKQFLDRCSSYVTVW